MLKISQTLAMAMLLVMFAVSCTGTSGTGDNAQNNDQQAGSTGQVADSNATTNVGGGSEQVVTADPGVQQSLDAQELMRHGDFEGAISILETMKANGDPTPDLDQQLIAAHTGYTQKIALSRGVDPKILNEVLYSHYSRILELDPENQEARMGLNAVNIWFEGHGMVLPGEIDPTLFLPDTQAESSENSGFVAGEEEPSDGE